MQSDNTKIKPSEFAGNTLGGKVGNTFIRVFQKIIESVTDWFEERLINFAVGVLIKVEKSGATVLGSLVRELRKNNALPDWLKPVFDEIENPKNEIGALLASTASSSAIGGLFGAIFDPLLAQLKYKLHQNLLPYIPDINLAVTGNLQGTITDEVLDEIISEQGYDRRFRDMFMLLYRNHIPFNELADLYLRGKIDNLEFRRRIRLLGFTDIDAVAVMELAFKIPSLAESIQSYFRGKTTIDELKQIAYKNGITEEFLTILLTASYRLNDLQDIRSIYFRDNKSDDWLNKQLKSLGFDNSTISDIKTILPYFPNVPDLIRFAVREVYSSDIIKKFDTDADFPVEFANEAQKAGLSKEQAINYWRAHWELPSPQMGFEMLHRGVIDLETLNTLLRTADVMPYWRDKIVAIAYQPLTRVDIRRMYNVGVLDEGAVFNAYKSIGYNDENANFLLEFTKKTKTTVKTTEKELTKADIIDGYTRRFFSVSEATLLFQDLGYDDTEIEYYLSKADYKEQVDTKKELLSLYADMYKKGIIDDNGVIADLSKQGLEPKEINYNLTKWALTKIVKPSQPSLLDLKNWLKAKIITAEFFVQELSNLGFAMDYVVLYYKEVTGKDLV